jgi:hypothetical protein
MARLFQYWLVLILCILQLSQLANARMKYNMAQHGHSPVRGQFTLGHVEARVNVSALCGRCSSYLSHAYQVMSFEYHDS